MESFIEFKERLRTSDARYRHATETEFRKTFFEKYSVWPDGEGSRREEKPLPHDKVLLTTESVSPFPVSQRFGIVSSECVMGMHIFKDIFSGLSDFFGGRSGTVQSELKKAKQICISELKREAFSLGANAVIAVTLNYSEISGSGKSMLFLVATGTAILIEESV